MSSVAMPTSSSPTAAPTVTARTHSAMASKIGCSCMRLFEHHLLHEVLQPEREDDEQEDQAPGRAAHPRRAPEGVHETAVLLDDDRSDETEERRDDDARHDEEPQPERDRHAERDIGDEQPHERKGSQVVHEWPAPALEVLGPDQFVEVACVRDRAQQLQDDDHEDDGRDDGERDGVAARVEIVRDLLEELRQDRGWEEDEERDHSDAKEARTQHPRGMRQDEGRRQRAIAR